VSVSERVELMTRAARRILLARIELAVEAMLIPVGAPRQMWAEFEPRVHTAAGEVLDGDDLAIWNGASRWAHVWALQLAAGELRPGSCGWPASGYKRRRGNSGSRRRGSGRSWLRSPGGRSGPPPLRQTTPELWGMFAAAEPRLQAGAAVRARRWRDETHCDGRTGQ